jgi:RNA 2',3'-cyclic 3'-phosphodiesterase
MKRIFIAIKVNAGEALISLIASLKSELVNENIRWINKDNIHITLLFLGDTEEKMIKEISSVLKDRCIGLGSFELIISGLGVFKNLHDPHVIWTGIELSDNLIQLNSTIVNGLRNLGLNIEERKFSPHLTIGRMRHLNDKAVLKTLIDKFQNKELQVLQVKEIILYESILSQKDPVYKTIAVINL